MSLCYWGGGTDFLIVAEICMPLCIYDESIFIVYKILEKVLSVNSKNFNICIKVPYEIRKGIFLSQDFAFATSIRVALYLSS